MSGNSKSYQTKISQSGSGVTKGPADPAVRGGAVLGGRQIVV